MWRGRHTLAGVGGAWRRVAAGWGCAAWVSVVALAVAGVAGAQVAGGASERGEAAVTGADGLLAYGLVQGWVRRGSVEAMAGDPVTAMRRRGVVGVRVVLRLEGRLMGVGQALTRLEGDADRETELVGLLRTATENAMDGARRRLDEASARARARAGASARAADGEGVERAAAEGDGGLPPWLEWPDIADRLTASLELGFGARRLRTAGGASASGWRPGREGLRSVIGQGRLAEVSVAWPGWGLAANLGARRQWSSATSEALGQERRVEAFSVVHVARPSLGGVAQVYDRGLPMEMAAGAATTQQARDAGQRLAGFLVRRVTTVGLVGAGAEPSVETAVVRPAEGLERAAALLALTEARRMGWVGNADWVRVEAAMRRATREIEAGLEEGAAFDLGEAGLMLAALSDPAWSAAWADAARARLEGVVGEAMEEGGRRRLDRVAIGLAGLAAAAERRGADGAERAALRVRVEAAEALAWRGVNVMAGWWRARAWDRLGGGVEAEGEAGGAGGEGGEAGRAAATAAAMGLMDRQVIALDADRRWQAGGLRFGPSLGGVEPDWETAVGMGWMAVAAREATGGDRVALLLGVGQSAGFVGRLQLTEDRLWYGSDPLAVLGGVRTSLMDNRLRLGPNAMVLLALADVVETTSASGVVGF
ncbi:MAG: hypothetical protein AAF823_12320 [Planctomycetota bacterium]